ncbi:MAG: Gfo/Idh/MocA family oxidoreductase [Candidatus Brocadiia bacterium]
MNQKGEKLIGYVDYELDNYHANVYLKHLREDLTDRGFRLGGCFALEEESGRDWAKKNHVPYFASPGELNEQCDYFMVLSPSNPELHLDLCKLVFPFGKPTYVDKTFAPDTATARKIFELADKHNVVMQTTSALRYTNVQDEIKEMGSPTIEHMVTWGGGRSFEEYAIHPLELAVSCMGPGVESVMRRGAGTQSQLLANFSGGRTAVVNVYTNAQTPYAASITTADETRIIEVKTADIFLNTLSAVLDLFEKGKPDIDRAESLIIQRILDAAEEPEAKAEFIML